MAEACEKQKSLRGIFGWRHQKVRMGTSFCSSEGKRSLAGPIAAQQMGQNQSWQLYQYEIPTSVIGWRILIYIYVHTIHRYNREHEAYARCYLPLLPSRISRWNGWKVLLLYFSHGTGIEENKCPNPALLFLTKAKIYSVITKVRGLALCVQRSPRNGLLLWNLTFPCLLQPFDCWMEEDEAQEVRGSGECLDAAHSCHVCP